MGQKVVYAIATGGLIKIGFTSNLQRRIKQLCHILKYEVVGFAPGGRAEERAVHHKLRAYRVKDEWFHDNDGIRAELRQIFSEGAPNFLIEGPNRWFASIALNLYRSNAAAALLKFLGVSDRSCRDYLCGKSVPKASSLATLLRGEDGEAWLRQIMQADMRGDKSPTWWLNLQSAIELFSKLSSE